MYPDFSLSPSCYWGMTMGWHWEGCFWGANALAAIQDHDVRMAEQQDKRGLYPWAPWTPSSLNYLPSETNQPRTHSTNKQKASTFFSHCYFQHFICNIPSFLLNSVSINIRHHGKCLPYRKSIKKELLYLLLYLFYRWGTYSLELRHHWPNETKVAKWSSQKFQNLNFFPLLSNVGVNLSLCL